MKKRDVWEKMKRKDLPPGVKLLGSKWVFKLKKNGVFRARLVAKGYDQIPGVDFTENFAPVVNNVTIRTVMILLLLNPDLIAYIVDVETAFLYGEMDVDLFMEYQKVCSTLMTLIHQPTASSSKEQYMAQFRLLGNGSSTSFANYKTRLDSSDPEPTPACW